MASSSGASSGSTLLQNSGSEEDMQALMDQRKRKRMISNRESARRSRMRKQQHMDDLMGKMVELRKENDQILASMNLTTQHYLNIEAENSILRAQVGELSQRLESLNEIIDFLNTSNGGFGAADDSYTVSTTLDAADSFMNPWNMQFQNQPIMASADMFQY